MQQVSEPIVKDLVLIGGGHSPVPGAAEYAIAAKPVSQLLAQWNQLVGTVAQSPQEPLARV